MKSPHFRHGATHAHDPGAGAGAGCHGGGSKRTAGSVVNLGGMAVTGRGRVTGEPLREVRVDLP
jgi:hypothetical protein